MAWRVNNVRDQRKRFVREVQEYKKTFTDICEEFGISRPTGYKWIQRYALEGEDGLEDRSSARHSQDRKTNKKLEEKILRLKRKYSAWGPKKIHAYLLRRDPSENWPSITTIGNILKRNGFVLPRKQRKRFPAKTDPLSHCKKPNDVWCVDFKGWFKTKDNIKCDPFTVTDAESRYILYCSKLHSGKVKDVWQTMEKLFYENGLPKYLRHDNGPPFATSGVGRLSTLSVNLIKAGVIPEWIDPGKPYQNGRHERMHGTLKNEGIFPLQLTLEEQQMRFRDFVNYFNNERPHEALNQRIPADVYVRSNRQWDGKLISPEYGSDYIVKRVRKRGQVGWQGKDLFIGKALAYEHIGFKEEENDGHWLVYYGPILLGTMDYMGHFKIPHVPHRLRKNYKERCY